MDGADRTGLLEELHSRAQRAHVLCATNYSLVEHHRVLLVTEPGVAKS